MIGTTVAKIPPQVYDSIGKNLGNTWVFLVVIVVLLILFIAVLFFKGKFSLKLPGGTVVDISGSSDKSKDKPKDKPSSVQLQEAPPTVLLQPQPAHANCPHLVDFKHVVTKTTYVVSKISEIKYVGCLSEQMGHVEEQFINIRTLLQKLYLEKLKEKLAAQGEEPIKKEEGYLYEDYKFYQALVKLMLHDMEAVIRASFANNHLAEYDAEGYQKYIDLKFNVIKGLESDFLDTMYIGDWVISRKDVFDLHRRSRAEVKEIIQNVYMNAKKVSITKGKEMEELQEELQEFMDETISGTIKVEITG